MSAYTVTAHDRDGRYRLTVSSRFGDRYTYAEHDDGPLSAARAAVAELFDVEQGDLRMVKLRDPNGGVWCVLATVEDGTAFNNREASNYGR